MPIEDHNDRELGLMLLGFAEHGNKNGRYKEVMQILSARHDCSEKKVVVVVETGTVRIGDKVIVKENQKAKGGW